MIPTNEKTTKICSWKKGDDDLQATGLYSFQEAREQDFTAVVCLVETLALLWRGSKRSAAHALLILPGLEPADALRCIDPHDGLQVGIVLLKPHYIAFPYRSRR